MSGRGGRQHYRGGGTSAYTRNLDELTRTFQGQKTDIDEMKSLFMKLSLELDQVKSRVRELESIGVRPSNQPLATSSGQQTNAVKEGGDSWEQDEKDKRKRFKQARTRERKAAKLAEKRAAISGNASQNHQTQQPNLPDNEQATNSNTTSTTNNNNNNNNYNKPNEPMSNNVVNNNHQTGPGDGVANNRYNRRTNRERNWNDKRRPRRYYEQQSAKQPLPRVNRNSVNDDSTTQAAEPSSEERPDGDDPRDGNGKERVKVLRRKKQHFNRRGAYGNRRRRADSSERNSNDTSPQNEANVNDKYQDKRKAKQQRGNNSNNYNSSNKRTFPELTESELNEVVQALKREFFSEPNYSFKRPLKEIKNTFNDRGPKVVYEFVASILDHALCDVTSPLKLSKIANRFYLLISEDINNDVDFQQGFFEALSDISKREDDIAIDAPRYMDTLGQILAECIVPMNVNKHRYLIKDFLNKCLNSYCQQNRPVLLASIMKSMASFKSERFAKEVWDMAQLSWDGMLADGVDLTEFLESNDVTFTTRALSPKPQRVKKDAKELEKFADDVTSLVEKRCSTQTLDDLVKDLDIEPDEKIDYMGTFIYAIVRGCLATDSGSYKLNTEALNKYSSILTTKYEDQEAIALHALTALTKLWHHYNCPQDLLRTILMALHNHGTAPYGALEVWLNSENLTNIPGIGAARLNSKRYIEDLGANLKQST